MKAINKNITLNIRNYEAFFRYRSFFISAGNPRSLCEMDLDTVQINNPEEFVAP